MLTWNVTYHCKPGQRDAFFQALCQLGVRNNSIHEEGNLKYDYFFDAQNTDALLLVDRLSPLLCLLTPACYGLGYLRGPQLRALVHGNIRQNKRKHNAKERKAREQRAKQMEQKNKKKE